MLLSQVIFFNHHNKFYETVATIIPPGLKKFWLSCVGDFTKMHNYQMESGILTLGSNALIQFPGR